MAPERNAPCPCGSGKKLKKCCGAPGLKKPNSISLSRLLAYQGDFGREREAFCLRYTEFKKNQLGEISVGLSQAVQSEGKTISCARGCSHCCYVYVAATLQECEAIVYFLYQHNDVLQNFHKNYDVWSEAVRGISDIYKNIGRLRSKQIAKTDTEADRDAFNSGLMTYAARDIPCPFLLSGACSIYEVRPYVCAGLVATTPGEWCRRLSPNHDKAEYIRREIQLYNDVPYFASPFGKVVISNMPALVNGILLRGTDFLYSALGYQPVGS